MANKELKIFVYQKTMFVERVLIATLLIGGLLQGSTDHITLIVLGGFFVGFIITFFLKPERIEVRDSKIKIKSSGKERIVSCEDVKAVVYDRSITHGSPYYLLLDTSEKLDLPIYKRNKALELKGIIENIISKKIDFIDDKSIGIDVTAIR